jgi:hypothetical protein
VFFQVPSQTLIVPDLKALVGDPTQTFIRPGLKAFVGDPTQTFAALITTRVKATSTDPALLFARSVKPKVPGVEGAPVSAPVVEFSDNPGGRVEPVLTEYVLTLIAVIPSV